MNNTPLNVSAVVLLNKPAGLTSFSALHSVKKFINKKTGHAGTLDRFATGLLIALSGKCTSHFDSFMTYDKTYRAVFEFGKSTSTQDPEGEITGRSTEKPTLAEIKELLEEKFSGEILQTPPAFSAVHINGKRAYELALKGSNFEIKPKKITISRSEIISYDYPFLNIEFDVSKGCYIRSIVRDMAAELGVCAYVKELCRTRIGPYSLDDAIPPAEIEARLADSSKPWLIQPV